MTIRTALIPIPTDRAEEPFGAPINITEAEQRLVDYLEGRALDYKRISNGRFYRFDKEEQVLLFKFKIGACNATLIELWRDGYLAEMRTPLGQED